MGDKRKGKKVVWLCLEEVEESYMALLGKSKEEKEKKKVGNF